MLRKGIVIPPAIALLRPGRRMKADAGMATD